MQDTVKPSSSTADPQVHPSAAEATGNSSGPPRAGRPEAAAAIWDWRGERAAGDQAGSAAHHRRQGVIQALVGAAVGMAIFLFWRPGIAYLVWTISTLTLLAALLSPEGVYAAIGRGIAGLSRWVGRLLGYVLLVPLFFLFFTLFGWLFRGGRKDRLERWFDRETASYWKPRQDGDRTLADYERQF